MWGFDLWSLGMSFKNLWEHDESILSKLMGLRIQFQSNSDSSCEKRVSCVLLEQFFGQFDVSKYFFGEPFSACFLPIFIYPDVCHTVDA